MDTTDSRPLHSSYDSQRTTHFPHLGELSEDPGFSAGPYDSLGKPLASISRTMEGKFVLDKDSEEGGFTSPRKPIRSLTKKKSSLSSYSRQPKPFIKWVNRGRDYCMNQFRNLPSKVEGGVYDVKAGTTHSLVQHTHVSPRLSLRTEELGGPRYDFHEVDPREVWEVQYPFQSLSSPEFGRHVIVKSPGSATPFIKQRRVRSSSPRPYVDEWNQLAQLVSFSDEVSSVRQPSSVERSFPSTVLSSFQNSAQRTPSMHGTPLNAASLLHENDRIIREQEILLQQNKLMLRQQELQNLPVMPQRQDFRNTHSVGAQVHASYHPPQPFIHHATGRLCYPEHFSSWMTPRRPSVVTHSHRPPPPHVRHRGPRSPLFHPPYREPFVYVPKSHAIPHHYVNVPPRQGTFYQRILGRDPYYLLKPSASENPKPLATSSPPRSRVQPQNSHIQTHDSRMIQPSTKPDTKTKSKTTLQTNTDTLGESDSSSDQPAAYTRDRLQKAIGRVRSGVLRTNGRPHSAPNLSSAGRTSSFFDSNKRLYVKVKKGQEGTAPIEDVFQEKSDEVSHEQSPNSSSGFGSKNTSQQQSSSQSGQSASALGLDTSRFEALESVRSSFNVSEWEKSDPHYTPRTTVGKQTSPKVHPPSYDQWLSRQVLPQFRVPLDGSKFAGGSYTLLMGVPRPGPSRLYQPSAQGPPSGRLRPPTATIPSPLYQNVVDAELDSFSDASAGFRRSRDSESLKPVGGTEPLTLSTSKAGEGSPGVFKHPPHLRSVQLTQPPSLDISVDDHYEFDTLLSPTSGAEDDSWSRSRTLSGERGLSDSEIYGSGGRRKEAHESMEARVAAMKQEFHEYRQRQAKRRSNRERESVC